MQMLLRGMRPDVVHVDLLGQGWARTVSVLIGGREPAFPHPVWDSGESTGDTELDEAVRSYVQRQLAERAGAIPQPRGPWA